MATTISDRSKMQTIADIYNMYAKDVLTYFLSYTHDMMAAEDMMHNLFIKVMSVDVVCMETAKSLLFVTASRMMADDARHKAYVRQYEKDALHEMNRMDSTSASLERKIDCDRIRQLEGLRIAQMSECHAEIYRLAFHEERTAKEVAEIMDMNIRTVEGHIYRARKEMREYLRMVL